MNASAAAVIKTMKSKGLTLALAESMTCGMAANKLSFVPGTSEVLMGSIVCYRPEVKMSVLKVPKEQIKKYSCESKEVTQTLVKHLAKVIKADIYAAITGLASEGGSETKEKPVGTVFISIKIGTKIYDQRQRFYGTPLSIHKKACIALYDFILSRL